MADGKLRISQVGWVATGRGLPKGMLDCKAHRVVKVAPAYMSQRCHECGHVAKGNRPSQSNFKRVSCGYEGNADINVALNILVLGMGAAGRRGAFVSVKAEPSGAGLSMDRQFAQG